ncbi:MAG: T9SS type A sorting domain-containing protein [Bacteroidales bacterium]|nr:T9SS type A sorting domain-containing protein [Bacteroidales bacterium]
MKKILILLLVSLYSVIGSSQDFELDSAFYPNYTFYSQSNSFRPTVQDLLLSPNDKLYVSGDCYNTQSLYDFTLLRFDSTGVLDNFFQPGDGFGIRLFNFKYQNDVLCSVGRKSHMYTDFHKYDESGNIINNSWSQNFHSSFYVHESQNGYLYDDEKVLFVGSFCTDTTYITNFDIIRTNPDGQQDTTLMADVYQGGSDVIWEIAPYQDNKLLVFGRWGEWFGDYTVEDGLRRIHLPSCAIDTSFNNIIENVQDSGFFSWLEEIHVLDDGKIIVVGRFKLKGIEKSQGIARLNPDGSLDSTFNNDNNLANFYDDYYGKINTITKLHDSTGYILGGSFKSYQGYERHCLVKTDLNGFIETQSFNGLGVDTISTFDGASTSWGVTQIIPAKNGKYYIGGQIDGFNGTPTQPVFRIKPKPYNINITELKDEFLQVHPNPFDNFITIQIPDELVGSEISIQSIEGRVIKKINTSQNQNQIELDNCAPGAYIVNILYDNVKRYSTKIIKN